MVLRIEQSKSAAAAKEYFRENLQRPDYYGQEGLTPGVWIGKGAERLGLEGQVSQDDFCALVDGKDPETGKRLGVRQKENRRPGYELTYSGPKSFASLWARARAYPELQERLLEVFNDSVRESLTEDVEPMLKTRLRRNGQDSDIVVGNMIAGLFLHDATRPLDDGWPDPHPHGHAYLMNQVWAPHENRFQAGQFYDLHIDRPFLEAAFEARLAKKLESLHLPIERHAEGWEIKGVPASVLAKDSRRTEEVEQAYEKWLAKRLEKAKYGVLKDGHLEVNGVQLTRHQILAEAHRRGLTDDKKKATLGAKTRRAKQKGVSRAELFDHWDKERTSPEERAAIDALLTAATGGEATRTAGVSAYDGMEHAIAHLSERDSAWSANELMAEALKFGVGSLVPEDVKKELAGHGLITATIAGHLVATTAENLAEEQGMNRWAWAGQGACQKLPCNGPYVFKRDLSGEQKAAVVDLLASIDRNRLSLLIGKAGTGKTTTLAELDDAPRAARAATDRFRADRPGVAWGAEVQGISHGRHRAGAA